MHWISNFPASLRDVILHTWYLQEKEWLNFEPKTLAWKTMKERIDSKLEGKVDPTDEIQLSDDQVLWYHDTRVT